MYNTVLKIRSLLTIDTFCIDHGIAYFNQNLSKKNIWVSFKVNMKDGLYTIRKNDFYKDEIFYLGVGGYDIKVFKAPVCKDPVFVADVKDIPYNISKIVGLDNYKKELNYLYLDAQQNSIVTCNGTLLHKSDIVGGVNDSLFIDPVVWDLMHHFKMTSIEKTDTCMMIKKDDVTITSLLPENLKHLPWDKEIPELKPYIPFTTEIKERITQIIKTFESHGMVPPPYENGSIGIVFHGTHIKTVLLDGRPFQMDLGVELFPDRIMSFDVRHLKLFLNVCNTGTLNYVTNVNGKTPVVITGENGFIDVIMPFYLKEDYYRSFDDCWVSLDTVTTE